MNTFRRITKPVTYVVAASVLAMSLQFSVANAAMVSTEAVVHSARLQQQHSRIQDALNRKDVAAKLALLGVDPAQVQARVSALTDEEALALTQQLDQMPAGGDIVSALVFIFVVLLLTDLLGVTDVFSFTHKGSLR